MNTITCYYLIRVTNYYPELSEKKLFDKIFNQTMESQKTWHESHDKDKNIQPGLFKEKAEQAAHNAVREKVLKTVLDTIEVEVPEGQWKQIKEKIEQIPNFDKWVITPTNTVHYRKVCTPTSSTNDTVVFP